jgi:murein DD-endopeptidase MepM/ murein hydrolase activator NlpD
MVAVIIVLGVRKESAYTDNSHGAGVVLPGQSTPQGPAEPNQALGTIVRYFDLELREDDTVALTDRFTNMSYYSTFTYYGPSDAEWLDISGGSSYIINGSSVIFYDVQGEISLTYRSSIFASRQDDTVTLIAGPWATIPFDIYINIYFPTWYQLTSAQPPGYTSGIGQLQWTFFNITSVSLLAIFDHTGGQRPLFDLPVDYNGRSDGLGTQFASAFRNRVTSLFDHRYPNYATDQKFLSYTGIELDDLSGVPCTYGFNCYDGHDAYDFDDRCPAQAPCGDATAVFPAADGTITQTGWLDNAGGCQIVVDHGNGWKTIYFHLRDSQNNHSCDGILIKSGQVNRFQKIGIIGESGSGADGTHLHFVVRNGNTKVDPSGWDPNPQVFPDPWTTLTGVTSYPMWMHSIRTIKAIAPETGGIVPSQYYDVIVNVPTAYSTQELVFNLTEVPVAGSSGQLVSSGHSFSLSAADSTGNPVAQLNEALSIEVRFTVEELGGIEPSTLSLYVWDKTVARWSAIPTTVDLNALTATAEVNHLSIFALMGKNPNLVFVPVVIR